jgi:hypothetical protein
MICNQQEAGSDLGRRAVYADWEAFETFFCPSTWIQEILHPAESLLSSWESPSF